MVMAGLAADAKLPLTLDLPPCWTALCALKSMVRAGRCQQPLPAQADRLQGSYTREAVYHQTAPEATER